jgi:hypothetical protein
MIFGGQRNRTPRTDTSLAAATLSDPLLYAVVAAAVAVCTPFLRYVLWLGDEGVFLHAAVRMLRGEVLYRDFFEFLPPGSFLLVATWMKVFGDSFAVARVLAISVIASIAALVYVTVRLSSGSRALATLLSIAWISVSQGGWTVVSHHWFTTAFSMASAVCVLLVVLSQETPRPWTAFTAGVLAGAAGMVTPTRGALLCVAIVVVFLTVPRPGLSVARAIAGIAVFPTGAVLYLAAHGALGAAFGDIIGHTGTRYAAIQAVPFGAFAVAADRMAVVFFPVTVALAVVDGVARWRMPLFRASLALAIVGLIGTYPRPDIVHINFTLPLLCPLFSLAVGDMLGRLGPRTRRIAGTVLIGLSVVGIGYALIPKMAFAAVSLRTIATARGLITRGEDPVTDDLALLIAQIDRVPPNDAFFFYPHSSMLPYLTGRRHVAAHDVITPGYTTPEQFRDTCVRVVGDAQWLVVDLTWVDSTWLRVVFPAMRDPDPPERQAFETALQAAFNRPAHVSKHFVLLRRAEKAPVALCDRIAASSETH